MPNPSPIIVWFRRDLRLGDNPALTAAIHSGRPVVPVFILDPDAGDPWPIGAAGRWWLQHSLTALEASLGALKAPLILCRGDELASLVELAKATGAHAVFCNQVVEPWRQSQDHAVSEALARLGLGMAFFSGSVLFDPGLTMAGRTKPWSVFGPFWRRCLALPAPGQPLPAPSGALQTPTDLAPGDTLTRWNLTPDRPQGWNGVGAAWTPGEASAQARLSAFLEDAAFSYQDDRDRVDRPGTSQLSPYLHWGEISVRQVWHAVSTTLEGGSGDASRHAFLRQLGWREFSTHLLHHAPHLPHRPLNPRFDAFPSRPDPEALAAWQNGRTGYPLVDAAMRQLAETGWMHNRLRMVAASFLVKHLLIPWQSGAAWFWDMLVDADLANNSASWQWVAGCGTDSAPFFRIFNPVLQAQRFDPNGDFIRHFIPELAHLPTARLHDPWRRTHKSAALPYLNPIIDHATARARALAAFHALPRQGTASEVAGFEML